jgi:DNA repair protein SbcD/Mre11
VKILHTADWHLGKRLEQFSRHAEQVTVLQEICRLADAHDVDAVLIAGDLFDNFNPPSESVELFYQTCKQLTNNGLRAVIAIAGNHDSPERIEAPNPLARACGIVLVGFPHSQIEPFALPTGLALTQSEAGFVELKLPRCAAPLRLLLTPYANEYRLKQYLGTEKEADTLRQLLTEQWFQLAQKHCDTEGVNLAMAHLFVMQEGSPPPEEGDDERPIFVGMANAVYTDCFPLNLQYVALGHLHRQQTVATVPCPIVYAGSPLAYSFAEENQEKYVVLLTAEPTQTIDIQRLSLESPCKLLRGRFESTQEALAWAMERPNDWLQLTIATDSYLDPAEQRILFESHHRIVPPIIPDIRNPENNAPSGKTVELERDMHAIFEDYFIYRNKGQTPNEVLRTLFKEVLAVGEEEEVG